MKEPNREPVLNTAEIHTMEHLGATSRKPSGLCRRSFTSVHGMQGSFYLSIHGDFSSEEVLFITEMFELCLLSKEMFPVLLLWNVGNYLDMNLPMANMNLKVL